MANLFDSTPYPINDFREWYDRKQLILSPKFQRRRVWQDKAKSYLIDTILRGLPIPPIFIRTDINPDTGKTVREVIDGQQRLSTILDFINNAFAVMVIHNEEYGGKYFNDLDEDTKKDFLKYGIITNTIFSSEDNVALDIFARLNTYTVLLNLQELWNAKYFGLFKKTVHELAYDFNKFWVNNKIISDRYIARMRDVEVTSELVIASLDGIQGTNVIENYYSKYDDVFERKNEVSEKFKYCISSIVDIYGEQLPKSQFRRLPLFYSLYCIIFDLLYGLADSSYHTRISFDHSLYPRVRTAIENIDAILEDAILESGKVDPEAPPEIKRFIENISRHTTNKEIRLERHNYLVNFILPYLR
jgi:predicted RNA-binding protein associated with RNAse of E/G family